MKVIISTAFLFGSFTLLAQNPNYIVNTPNIYSSSRNNTVIGIDAGKSLMSNSSVLVGYRAGSAQLSLTGQNTYVGTNAGENNYVGRFNTYLGYGAGSVYDIGSFNVFLGANAGQYSTNSEYNTFVGLSAGNMNSTGSRNVLVGYNAGANNGAANFNTIIGYQAGNFTVADSNTYVGYESGYDVTTGRSNVFFGVNAGRGIKTGSHNTIIGNKSGPASIDTDDNVYIGYSTGNHDTGTGNTFIGTRADASADKLKNATAIGANSHVATSNALILGNQVNVGIGTSAPKTRLEIVNEREGDSGLRLSSLSDQSPVALSTDQFLTVNSRGDVIKARYRLIINHSNEWSDKVFSPTYQLRSLPMVESYIQQHGHLPDVPSADEVASKGVDLVKINAMLLQKIEELTLYSIEQQKQISSLQKQIKKLASKR